MNCDQVFDILTRGPFPSGAPSDADVQRHLATCAECHQLAEALRPALDLIHESVSPEESWGLPGYWDDVPAQLNASDATATEVAAVAPAVQRRPLSIQPVSRPARIRAMAAYTRAPSQRNYVVAAVVGVLAACLAFFYPLSGSNPPREVSAAVPLPWPAPGCQNPAPGVPDGVEALVAQLEQCTECHSNGSEHWLLKPVGITVAATCSQCHRFVPLR